jgi:hypothetical protein
VFNRELKRRVEKYIGRNEAALCPKCFPAWKAEREHHAAKKRQREDAAWAEYKVTAKRYGVKQARFQIPVEFKQDYGFLQLASKWDAWWQLQERKGRKGVAYDEGDE